MTGIEPEVRALLVCPRCRGELEDRVEATGAALVCAACHLAYPVEEGVPFLVEELARDTRIRPGDADGREGPA